MARGLLVIAVAALSACASEYHPAYHPQSQYSVSQNVSDDALRDHGACSAISRGSLLAPLSRMSVVAVLYATREGHSRRVAERVATGLHARHHTIDVRDLNVLPAGFSLAPYAAAVLATSVHYGKVLPEATEFVRAARSALEKIPTAFLLVSAREATIEDPTKSAAVRADAAAELQKTLDDFYAATSWHPTRVKNVAGAVMYSKYGFLMRWMVKTIMKREGGPSDTSRDYDFTDWKALDRFAEEIANALPNEQESAASAR